MSVIRNQKRKTSSTGDDALVERLRDLLEYDPLTGELFWKRRQVETINGEGYLQVVVDGRSLLAHRAIFAMETGAFPQNEIDHINRAKADNRWANMREATRSENMLNTGMLKNNTSGFRGVSWHNEAWCAAITIKGVKHHLGRFSTPEAASRAYIAAKTRLVGDRK